MLNAQARTWQNLRLAALNPAKSFTFNSFPATYFSDLLSNNGKNMRHGFWGHEAKTGAMCGGKTIGSNSEFKPSAETLRPGCHK
jgi:hypothetical protein